MINEAVYTLYEGVGNVESIDTAMKLGANHPMGPLELADFIGLDTCLAVMQVLYEGLADSQVPAVPAAGEVRRGRLARPQDQARLLRLPRRDAGPDPLTPSSRACSRVKAPARPAAGIARPSRPMTGTRRLGVVVAGLTGPFTASHACSRQRRTSPAPGSRRSSRAMTRALRQKPPWRRAQELASQPAGPCGVKSCARAHDRARPQVSLKREHPHPGTAALATDSRAKTRPAAGRQAAWADPSCRAGAAT